MSLHNESVLKRFWPKVDRRGLLYIPFEWLINALPRLQNLR